MSVTESSTESGISIETGLSLMYLTITLLLGKRYCMAVPMMSVAEMKLVVGLGVHEDVLVARGVEVLVLLGLHVRHLDLIDRAEPLVDQRPVVHVPQLGLDHGPEVARGVVGEVDDDEVHPVDGDHHSPADVGRFEQHGGLRLSASLFQKSR